mmetsp:Transcript_51987/g.62535  ORF Transcript_51987/g.62535 Transcript_51987/m.62535 type:complete len:208 (-) Transcript_51987:159-782(-)|eukprot:CAMPEP_0172495012 /NCGR_PEP_ID=MMETSP1066-20121228/61819_1 /TAXON_ID=671091 /ORGANISM="Coscinodiscus wailesii, Strain CCMP2513" /LENGTH=207 /DNA_ID=CAMNT_0013266425 /DNA_START=100 /DNA_END=723 /DNA_ORIENTATION=-
MSDLTKHNRLQSIHLGSVFRQRMVSRMRLVANRIKSHNSDPTSENSEVKEIDNVNAKEEIATHTNLELSFSRSFDDDATHETEIENDSRQRVCFGHVQIREYPNVLGDNPSCSSGLPLTLDWKYAEFRTVPLDDYEYHRGPRRMTNQLKMTAEMRKNILMSNEGETSVSADEVRRAERKLYRERKKKCSQRFFAPLPVPKAVQTMAF